MKKGFTLIELLAVIIILAIVALIATPIILNVIDDARKSAAESEASMILSGINNYCATADMKDQLNSTQDSICLNAAKNGYEVTAAEVGQMVTLGKAKIVSVTYGESGVSALVVESNGYTVTLSGNSFSLSKGVASN